MGWLKLIYVFILFNLVTIDNSRKEDKCYIHRSMDKFKTKWMLSVPDVRYDMERSILNLRTFK